MKKQANILYILCISAICITTAPSCNVLDLEQLSSIPYDEAFGTYQRCELSTLGCYAYAQGEYRGFPFGSRSTAINDIRGEDVMSSTYMGSSYEATFTTSSGDLSNHWSYLFRLVNQANIVIDGVQNACDEGIISQEEADKKFEAWKTVRDAKINAKIEGLSKAAAEAVKAAEAAEAKVNQERAEALAKKKAEAEEAARAAAEAAAAEKAAEEAAAAGAEETPAETAEA